MVAKKKRDWLSLKHSELDFLANHVWRCLNNDEIRTRLGYGDRNVESSPSYWLENVFKPHLDRYSEVFIASEDPELCTPVVKVKLLRFERELKAVFRKLYSGFIWKNPFVQVEDLVAMGLPVPSKHRTHIPAPKTVPLLETNRKTLLVWLIGFKEEGARHHGRPDDVAFIEVRRLIKHLGEAPPDYSELMIYACEASSLVKMMFDIKDLGKVCYVAARWLNSHGEPGDWSLIYSFVIG